MHIGQVSILTDFFRPKPKIYLFFRIPKRQGKC